VLEETNASGKMTSTVGRDYIFFAGRRIAWRDSSGHVYYYFADVIGSTRAVTNATGSRCFDADYYPYGQENDYTSTLQTTACSPTYKFTGYEYDSETDNYYAMARYYNPRLGRFMSPDPLPGVVGNPQSLNRYSYVLNNPETFVDPSGMMESYYEQALQGQFDEFDLLFSNYMFVEGGNVTYMTRSNPDAFNVVWYLSGIPGPGSDSGSSLSQTSHEGASVVVGTCSVSARVLQGNPRTVGAPLYHGAFNNPPNAIAPQAGSAAMTPSEFGGFTTSELKSYALQINGYFPGTGVSFHGVTDVNGSHHIPRGFSNIRQYLEFENPGQIIIELITGWDMGSNVPAVIQVPTGVPCPTAPPFDADPVAGPTVG
jgi:RHS repeat-associated protein